MKRVLIAEDHRMLADAFERLLPPEFEVVGKVADGLELLEVAAERRPDLILLDVSMPRINGLDAARRLREVLPDVRLVVITMHKDVQIAARALRAGADGFVLKSAAASELREAITTVAEGGTYLTPLVPRDRVEALLDGAPGKRVGSRLTTRQREVLQLLAEGLAMKQVARALGLSTRTIAHHKYKIMEEQGIDSDAGLVQLAMEERLIPRPGP